MYLAIRIRGRAKINYDTAYTLKLLRLTRNNHAAIFPKTRKIEGMLKAAKDYIAWGELNKDTLVELIEKKGRLVGDLSVTEEYVKTTTIYQTLDELADALIHGKIEYKDVKGVKPLFRLDPPKGGFENTKRSFKEGGTLGYRGKDINKLVKKMLGYG